MGKVQWVVRVICYNVGVESQSQSSEVGQVGCVRMKDLRDDACSFEKCISFYNCE